MEWWNGGTVGMPMVEKEGEDETNIMREMEHNWVVSRWKTRKNIENNGMKYLQNKVNKRAEEKGRKRKRSVDKGRRRRKEEV